MRPPDPVEHDVVVDQVAGADAAGEHDDVRGREVVVGGVDLDAEEAVVRAHDAALAADERDLVAGDALQHLVRADPVEGGEAGEQGDGDGCHGHSFRW